jgi:Tol biopolymer transport system component/aminoglycoside phosphotransferase (APT) family kinase protein
MALTSGTRLGSYEITSQLGAGGMGEVYRATDSKLKRDVAIKVLPAEFLQDADRLERFEREAQLLAQLHHPNIASVFGLEESGGSRALVMEMVDGDDLSARIARGPIPLDEALPIARQIAEALEAAHAAGIVHRDLKPANVKVKADGTVKVLDFGLAKALEPAPLSGGGLANSPTLTGRATQLGMIMGTAAYMAPEQARGSAVDKRVDVWAFGVVLYEMLTGDQLFDGESAVDTLSAVMRKEIDLGRLPAHTPPELRRLMRRCLERIAKNRLHDIADARIVLDELQRGVQEESPSAGPTAPPPTRRLWVPLASVAALALAAGAGAGWLSHRPPPSATPARWALALPDGYTLSTGDFPQLALSEDGRLQAVVAADESSTPQLLLRSVDQIEPRVLAEAAGANSPFFSPDGAWIGFFRDNGLFKIAVSGGPPIPLASVTAAVLSRGATWSRDGYIYFTPAVNQPLSRVAESGGDVEKVTKLEAANDERTHRWPQALPDGSAILFTCDSFGSTEYYDDARIEAVRPSTGERKVLVEGASQAWYAGGGHLLFARGGSVFRVPFDPKSLSVTGSPEIAVQGVATDVGSGAVQFAVSPSGAALWAPGSLAARYTLSWVDRHGAEVPAAVTQAPYNEAELSPDGKRVALIGGSGGLADVWVADLERGTQTRITSGESVLNPTWSRDATRLAYIVRAETSGKERRWRLMIKPADGSRDAVLVLDSPRFISLGDFTPDGKEIVFSSQTPGANKADLYALALSSGSTPRLIVGDGFNKREAVVSPDGRYLAYVSNEGGQTAVFVRPYPAGEGRWPISPLLSLEPRWSPDGRELFFRCRATLYRVPVETRAGFSPGKADAVFDRVSNGGGVKTYAPAPDGARFFTFRSPAGRGSMRTVNLDLGFSGRIAGPP